MVCIPFVFDFVKQIVNGMDYSIRSLRLFEYIFKRVEAKYQIPMNDGIV